MSQTQVLLIDGTVLGRRYLGDALEADPTVRVTARAATLSIALSKLRQVPVDAVLVNAASLDEPPDGVIETVRTAAGESPLLVLHDSETDPDSPGCYCFPLIDCSEVALRQCMRSAVLPCLAELFPAAAAGAVPPVPPVARGRARPLDGTVKVLAIGVSTGGPNALAAFLPRLAKSLPVPVVVVQHMPVEFTRQLAERLDGQCALPVEEGREGERLRPGRIWVAPGDYHMEVRRHGAYVQLHLQQEPPENSVRPAVDPLFRSVARVYGAGTLAVVMTGMGKDGLRGCEAIRHVGGQILVQDQATSVVWGMPGTVANAGLADAVLPLNRLAAEVSLRIRRGRGGPEGDGDG